MATCIATVLVGSMMYVDQFYNEECSDKSLQYHEIYGRNDRQSYLIDSVNKNDLVSVCGLPGIGKSVLVTNALLELEKQGYCIIYVDVSKLNNVSDVVKSLYSKCNCITYVRQILLRIWYYMNKRSIFDSELLTQWSRRIQSQSIIFLDNINGSGSWNLLCENVIEPLLFGKKSAGTQTLKIVVTSQNIDNVQCNDHTIIIPLGAIDYDSCANWISRGYSSISYSEGRQLCQAFGGIPLAVDLIARLVANPDPRNPRNYTVAEVVSKMSSLEYGQPLVFFEGSVKQVLGDSESYLVKALSLIYESLELKYRSCIFLLVDVPSTTELSYGFVEKRLGKILTYPCLTKLLSVSFIEKHELLVTATTVTKVVTVFEFAPFIRHFIQGIGEPTVSPDKTLRQIVRKFWGNHVQDYIKEYRKTLLNEEKNLALAVQIGSNKPLVNSLLPLLDENFNFRPLFEHAWNVIDRNFCNCVGGNCGIGPDIEASRLIYAYSYLTKAVHCPSIHPASLVMEYNKTGTLPSHDNSCSQCSEKLRSCETKLTQLLKGSNNSEVAEAFAYYNALIISTSHNCNLSYWRLWLYDLAMIVTTANQQCKLHCLETEVCSCGQESDIELALYNILLRQYKPSTDSKYYLKRQINGDRNCQYILKILFFIMRHIVNRELIKESQEKAILDIIEQFDPLCYLSVTDDIILPFFREMYPNETEHIKSLKKKQNEMIKMVKSQRHHKRGGILSPDEHPLIRYAIFPGFTAFREKRFHSQWAEKIEWIEPRELWVCSVIKDQRKNCQDSFKFQLPLITKLREVQTVEGQKIYSYLKYLMEDESSKLDAIVRKIPSFYYWLVV